jgi:hypothetical protein
MNEKEARTWAGRRQIVEINARRPMNTPSPNRDEKFTRV